MLGLSGGSPYTTQQCSGELRPPKLEVYAQRRFHVTMPKYTAYLRSTRNNAMFYQSQKAGLMTVFC